ncbi:hypothetical protein Tco_1498572, partial [Tanacetum coccineum]
MSLGNLLPPWHQFLDQKIRGAHFSLGIVAGERFAIEFTPSTFPQRHVAGDIFPQRHVAGERVGMLLGKASNVVVVTGTSFGTPNTSTKLATADPNNIPPNEKDDGSVNVIQSAKSNGMGHVPYANLLNGEPIKKAVNFHTLMPRL